MIPNTSTNDLALLELLAAGQTDAPLEVLAKLTLQGFVETAPRGDKPALTAAGRKRAEALRPFEHDMRRQTEAQASGQPAIKAIASTPIH